MSALEKRNMQYKGIPVQSAITSRTRQAHSFCSSRPRQSALAAREEEESMGEISCISQKSFCRD